MEFPEFQAFAPGEIAMVKLSASNFATVNRLVWLTRPPVV